MGGKREGRREAWEWFARRRGASAVPNRTSNQDQEAGAGRQETREASRRDRGQARGWDVGHGPEGRRASGGNNNERRRTGELPLNVGARARTTPDEVRFRIVRDTGLLLLKCRWSSASASSGYVAPNTGVKAMPRSRGSGAPPELSGFLLARFQFAIPLFEPHPGLYGAHAQPEPGAAASEGGLGAEGQGATTALDPAAAQ